MEERIRQMPEKTLDWGIFCLFSVFAVCPLVNYLIVAVWGLPDYSWGFVFMSNPVWEIWNSLTLACGVVICSLYGAKAYLGGTAPKLMKHPALLLFLAFALWMAVATCVNGVSRFALMGNEHRMEGMMSYGSYLMYFLLAAIWKDEKLKSAWMWIFAGAAAVLELCLIGDKLLFSGKLQVKACGAVFYNSNHFGYYILMSGLVCALRCVTAEKRWQRGIWWGMTVITAEALLLSDTQGAMIGFVFALVLMVIVCPLSSFRPLGQMVLPFLAVAVVFLLNRLPGFQASNALLIKNLDNTASQMQAISEGMENAPDTLGSGRLGLWRWTLEKIRERPLFGYGSDALAEEMEQALRNSRCHCEYMHYALSYGIPAAILYIAGVLAVYLRGLRRRRSLKPRQIVALCAAFGYMVSAAVGNTMWYTAPFAFILLGLGY